MGQYSYHDYQYTDVPFLPSSATCDMSCDQITYLTLAILTVLRDLRNEYKLSQHFWLLIIVYREIFVAFIFVTESPKTKFNPHNIDSRLL